MAASTKLSDYGLSDKMGFKPSTQPMQQEASRYYAKSGSCINMLWSTILPH